MEIPQDIRNDLLNAQTRYNFMAIIYSFISKCILPGRQVYFIKSMGCRNYLKKLSLSEDFFKIISDEEEVQFLLDLLEGLYESGFRELNSKVTALCESMYAILQAIDNLFTTKDMYESEQNYGPLNTLPDDCYIYFRGKQEHHQLVSASFNRGKVGSKTFTSLLKSFTFVLKNELPEIVGTPRIIHLTRTRLKPLSEVTVVAFPWGITKNFNFVSTSNFITVSYSTDEAIIKKNCDQISSFLNQVITQINPNIIVFPEYSIPPYGLKTIRDTLVSNINHSTNLDLIFAGTTWVESGLHPNIKNNNILTILARNGDILGRYFKYSPFVQVIENKINKLELLSNPGKEITMVDIDDIGIVLPSICRDIIDDEITTLLAKSFLPSYIIIPAYSHSIHSFVDQIRSLAHKYHCNAIVCNLCESINSDSTDEQRIGIAGSAKLINTTVDFDNRFFIRDNNVCSLNCVNSTCYFKISFKWTSNGGDEVELQKMYLDSTYSKS